VDKSAAFTAYSDAERTHERTIMTAKKPSKGSERKKLTLAKQTLKRSGAVRAPGQGLEGWEVGHSLRR